MSSSQPADRAVGAVPVDHPEGSTSPTPLPSGSAAAGAHRPSEDCSQPADARTLEQMLAAGEVQSALLLKGAYTDVERGLVGQAYEIGISHGKAAVAAELREVLPPLVELSHRLLRYTAQIGEGDWTPQDVLGHNLANGVTALSRGAPP